MSAQHEVFVLSVNGAPLTPTTPARARKMLKAGVARPRWSKFSTFGIQMLTPTRYEVPKTTLGVDNGTKFEGYAVVCGRENSLSVKLDLPDKRKIVRKLAERRTLRRMRRFRNCRRRPVCFSNRKRKGSLAPSQSVVVFSPLKSLREFFRLYPIQEVGFEDVHFPHAKHRWGANFSTVETGKRRIKTFLAAQGAQVIEFRGHETKQLRVQYGYQKTSDKSADTFTAHCSDALALACAVGLGERVKPSMFLVVDDTYRPVRRRLHCSQPAKGGVRALYSRGTVFGIRKGMLVGISNGNMGCLCGAYQGTYRYYDIHGKRQATKRLLWVSNHFMTRRGTIVDTTRTCRLAPRDTV